MREIELTQGQVALVDDEDYVMLSQYKWHARRRDDVYIPRWLNPATHIPVPMHHMIMSAPDGLYVDHINRNPLDNRRQNLRLVTHRQNCLNRRRWGKTSEYRGVCWSKKGNAWVAQITVRRNVMDLGRYCTQEDAARAYNIAAREFLGEFAQINKVDNPFSLPQRRKRGDKVVPPKEQ